MFITCVKNFLFHHISGFFVHFFGQKVEQDLGNPDLKSKLLKSGRGFYKKKVLPKEHFQKPITLLEIDFFYPTADAAAECGITPKPLGRVLRWCRKYGLSHLF